MGRPSRRFAEICATETPGAPPVVIRRAIVLGGSVAGMLAARVLSEHADEVVVLERDDLDPSGATGPHPGVPQGTQVHALLHGGRLQLDRWFPGFAEELVADGAVVSGGTASVMFIDGRRKVPVFDIENICCSRYFLEGHIRRRVMTCDNVRMIRGRATGLRFAAGRVIGVACEQDGQGRIEDADFVVDATGRSSRLGDWLERGGWQRPPARRMNVDLNYATAVFSRGDELNGVTSAVAFESSTAEQAGGGTALVAIEDQRWMLVVAGYVEDRPSRDPEDFARRARQQPSLFGEVVTKTRMTEPVVTFRQAESIRRDFHRLDRLPGGLVAAGDAVASFNPVYGQGMTSAILHASCLSAYLRSGARPAGPATGYFARVRTVVDAAWQTSTFADLALPHVAGPYPRGYRIASRLSGLIAQASVTDAEINSTFLRVTNMVVHPSVLVRPAILLRAARAVRRQRRADAATPTPVTAPTT